MMDREEQQHRNNVTLPRSCSSSAPGLGTGLSLLEGSAHLGPLNVLSNSDCSWLRASQPQENVELCLVLSKCSQGLGMVMPAAKAGVHRGLLVTITGYYLHFNGPTKGKKDPYFQLLHCSQSSMVYQNEEICICPGSLQSVGLVGLSSSCLPSAGLDWLSDNVSL